MMTAATNDDEKPGPVTAGQRIVAIDTLRGFALLGILVMNVTGMAMPFAAYFNPLAYGGTNVGDFSAWVVAHVFFDLKMMGIFSMLFGAGLALMAQRAEARGQRFGRVYYRRLFWLFVIGMLHAWFLWFGDILVTYAICGTLLFLFRRRSVPTLIVSGLVFLVIGSLLSFGGGFVTGMLRDVAQEIQTKVAAGEEMTPRRQELLDQWHDMRRAWQPTPEDNAQTIRTWRGGAGEVLRANAAQTVMMQTQAIPFELFWRAMALMLFGMAMMKAGGLDGSGSVALYNRYIALGLGIGLPVVAFGAWQSTRHEFDFIARYMVDGQYNYFASVLISLAYVGLVMRFCQSGALAGLRARLAAVGRMALSNYLLQSLLAALVFYGYGFALFGQVSRAQLWWFILAVWALQLWVSPWWLARFRFGPAEWLWRSLTYARAQPLRIR